MGLARDLKTGEGRSVEDSDVRQYSTGTTAKMLDHAHYLTYPCLFDAK